MSRRGPPAPLLVVQDLVFFLVTAIAHGVGPALTAYILSLGVPWWAALPVLVVLYPLGVIFTVAALDRLVPRVPAGRHPLNGPAFIRWGLHLVLYRVARLPPAQMLIRYSNVLRFLWLRTLGGDVDFTAQLSGDVNLLDHYPLRIGAGAVIGSETMLSTHIVVRDELRVDGISVGEGALVGAQCVLGPGVTVGEGAVVQVGADLNLGSRIGARAQVGFHTLVDVGASVGEGAVVEPRSHILPHTHVPPGERWGGVPARRLDPPASPTREDAPSS